MTKTNKRAPHILIGASSFTDAKAALALLGVLKYQANLGGLLVEERETLALCQTVNQRIITSSGAVMVAPDLSQMRTMIEADAKAFCRSLAQICEPVGASWTFERSEGDLVQVSLQASAGWDIVVLGHRHVHPGRGNIVLLEHNGAEDQTLRAFADQLGDRLSAARLVFSVGQGQATSLDARSFETVQDMLSVLARTNVQAVLLDVSQGPIRSVAELKQLLDVARCPIFAFGAAMSGTILEHSTRIPPPPGTDGDPLDG